VSLVELPIFLLLGIVANAWLPLPPFEPVLLAFAHTRPLEPALVVAAVGSLAAAIGEGIGAGTALLLLRRPPRARPMRWLAATGRSFYFLAGLIALSPAPITLVRVAAFWRRPRPVLYGLAVGLGRLPRYLLLVWAWHGLVLAR